METVRFFYKDHELVDSLYAQLFSGLLSSVQTESRSREDTTAGINGKGEGKICIPPLSGKGEFSGSMGLQNGHENSKIETFTTHDKAIVDVLQKLGPDMKGSVKGANFGDILNITGHMFYVPKQLEKSALEAFQPFMFQTLEKNKEASRNKNKQVLINYIKKISNVAGDDCRFIFETKDNDFCIGSLKIDGFSEDALSLFFKYMAKPIPCTIVGISEKQTANDMGFLGNETIYSVIQKLSAPVAAMWYAGIHSAIPIAPIAIYHKINISEEI